MRSFMSVFAAGVLRLTGYKRKVNNERSMARYMEKCRRRSAKPFSVPKFSNVRVNVKKELFEGMEIFLFKKEGAQSDKVLLYFHGGGYVEQPLPQHFSFVGEMVNRTGIPAVFPVYPKAPDHTYKENYPLQLELYEKILETHRPENVIIAGDSSGGGMALAFAEYLAKKNLPQPGKLVLLSPWVDINMDNPELKDYNRRDPSLGINGLKTMAKAWAGGDDLHDYLLSPLYGDLTGLADIYLFIGTGEMLCADARKLRARAKQQGVKIHYYEYPKMNHVFPLYPIPEADIAKATIADIISD